MENLRLACPEKDTFGSRFTQFHVPWEWYLRMTVSWALTSGVMKRKVSWWLEIGVMKRHGKVLVTTGECGPEKDSLLNIVGSPWWDRSWRHSGVDWSGRSWWWLERWRMRSWKWGAWLYGTTADGWRRGQTVGCCSRCNRSYNLTILIWVTKRSYLPKSPPLRRDMTQG